MENFRKWLILAAFAVCGMLYENLHAEVYLTKDGKASSTIVLGPERSKSRILSWKGSKTAYTVPSNVLLDATNDLAKYLNDIAEIEKPNFRKVCVVNDIKKVKTKYRILLGSVAIKEYGLEKEAEALSYPSYIYRTVGNDLLIFGFSPKGTANGIYGFLQAELGVRWFGNQDLFRVLPKSKTVVISNLNKRVSPSFPGRLFHCGLKKSDLNYIWRREMRMGEGIDNNEPFINSSHNLYRIYPYQRYLKSHPEYFPMRNGKRMKPNNTHWTPCLSNPEVVDIAIKRVKNFFRGDKHRHSFSLGINDTGIHCQCEKCQKLNTGLINFRGTNDWESDSYYFYVNKVARAVAKEYPSRYIGTIAYNRVTAPPVGPVEKNVNVVIVSDISEYFDPAYRKFDEELISAWEKKDISLGLYFYQRLAKLTPAYFPHLVSQELKNKHKRGFTNITIEAGPGWPWFGPMSYVTAQQLWDVTLNVDEILREYFSKLYGPAAKPMSRLYALFEECHMRPRKGGFLYEHYKLAQFRPYTANDLAKMREYLAEARSIMKDSGKNGEKTPNDIINQRIAYVSNGLKVFFSMLEAYSKVLEFGKPVKSDNISANKRLDEIERLNTILANHDALYRETIINDKSQGRRYAQKGCVALRNSWKKFVSSAISKSMADIYRWSKNNKVDNTVKSRFDKALAAFLADPERKAMFQVESGKAKLGPNLVLNPGFEKTTGKGKHPIGPGWVPAKADNWSLFPDKDKTGLTVVSNEKHSGKSASCISGIKSGTYITTIPNVKVGESYSVSAYVKCLSPKRGEVLSRVTMDVQWFKDDNKWWKYGKDKYSTELRDTDKWIKMKMVIVVPKGPSAAVLLLSADNLDADQKVFFDDVKFQKIEVPTVSYGPNLMDNGGFERVYGTGNCPKGRKPGFPQSWHGQPKNKETGVMTTTKTDVHGGKRAGMMKGGKGCYFLKPSRALGKPGGFYYCEAWVKSNSPDTNVFMEIRWYGGDCWAKQKGKVRSTPLKKSGEWTKLEVVASPPEGAMRMAVFLIAENLKNNDVILFDDVQARRIKEKK